jgi:hypothetical protein
MHGIHPSFFSRPFESRGASPLGTIPPFFQKDSVLFTYAARQRRKKPLRKLAEKWRGTRAVREDVVHVEPGGRKRRLRRASGNPAFKGEERKDPIVSTPLFPRQKPAFPGTSRPRGKGELPSTRPAAHATPPASPSSETKNRTTRACTFQTSSTKGGITPADLRLCCRSRNDPFSPPAEQAALSPRLFPGPEHLPRPRGTSKLIFHLLLRSPKRMKPLPRLYLPENRHTPERSHRGHVMHPAPPRPRDTQTRKRANLKYRASRNLK